MKYSELKSLARAYVPQATVEQIDDNTLALMLRQGALDVAMRTFCLKAEESFDSIADQKRYVMSTMLNRYLNLEKSGIWWLNGATYQRVYPRTVAWLDENKVSWRNEASGNPIDYAIEAGDVIFSPPPSEGTTDAFLASFAQIPPPPVTDDYYPFGGATEITRLAPLSECILYYYKWKALGILGKSQEMDAFKPSYLAEVTEKRMFIETRKDISQSEETKLMGRQIR
jgi:hypothetical protein